MPTNRVYVVLVIVLVMVATGIGFVMGQMSASKAPATREIVTVTQKITEMLTVTVQASQQTAKQPTREELLAPIIEAAKKEGKLIIYAGFDRPSAEPLLQAFKAKYPFIDIEYIEMSAATLYNRYLSERAAGVPTADILQTSAMDHIYSLIFNYSAAQPYRLTIYDRIPEYAKYKDLLYMFSWSLNAPIYNTEKIPKDLAPKSYADVLKLLTQRKDLFPPQSITVSDVTRSVNWLIIGYYLYKAKPDLIQGIVSAAGSIGVVLQAGSGPQLEMVKTGQATMAITTTANYAFRDAVNDSRVGAFVPNDIAVLLPRAIFITKEAQHPNAAKLFLEFIMSDEAQDLLARVGEVVRGDNRYFPQLSINYLKANVKELFIVNLDDPWLREIAENPSVRNNFLSMWKKWLGIG